MPIFEGSFRSRAIKDFYYTDSTKKIPVHNIGKLRNILDYINAIDTLPPRSMLYRTHEHKGAGKGTWSFDLEGSKRVLCEFDAEGDPINIRIEDPH